MTIENEVLNLARKLISLAHQSDGEPSASDIMVRVRDVLAEAVDTFPRTYTETPPTVAEYFQAQLGGALEAQSDPSHPNSPAHPQFTIESGCGEDCKVAIDAAAALLAQVRAAYGDDLPYLVEQVRETTREVVTCYVYG